MPLLNVTDEELITLRAALNHAEQTYGDPVNSVRIASARAALSREHAQPGQVWTPLADGTYDHIGIQRNGEVICFGEHDELGQRFWSGRFLPNDMRLCRLTPPAQEVQHE